MGGDLLLLVADKNMEYAVRGLLSRPQAIEVRPLEFKVSVHPQRDPGCARKAHDFLRSFARQFEHAVVMFDRRGSGREELSAADLTQDVRGLLARNGWGDRAEVIVLDPELEVWVFVSSPAVEQCLGWESPPHLRRWLLDQDLWGAGQPKPADPKEALERTLRSVARPRSSSIYECLGRMVDLDGCSDPAFLKFRDTLVQWFPARPPEQ